jgi:hypothetical protein
MLTKGEGFPAIGMVELIGEQNIAWAVLGQF